MYSYKTLLYIVQMEVGADTENAKLLNQLELAKSIWNIGIRAFQTQNLWLLEANVPKAYECCKNKHVLAASTKVRKPLVFIGLSPQAPLWANQALFLL